MKKSEANRNVDYRAFVDNYANAKSDAGIAQMVRSLYEYAHNIFIADNAPVVYWAEADEKYPQYQFAKHKGYGTKLHYECIEQFGISPVHRLTFLKKILDK